MDFKILRVGRGAQKPKKFKTCDRCGRDIENYRIEYNSTLGTDKENLCIDCIMDRFDQREIALKGGNWLIRKFRRWLMPAAA